MLKVTTPVLVVADGNVYGQGSLLFITECHFSVVQSLPFILYEYMHACIKFENFFARFMQTAVHIYERVYTRNVQMFAA